MRFLRVTLLWILLLPYLVTFTGAASNQLVLIANHDKFPVMVNPIKLDKFTAGAGAGMVGLIDDVHCVMTKDTHLNVLADIFDMHDAIYSVGDGLLMLGEWLNGFCFYVWCALVLYKLNRGDDERQTTSRSCAS